MVAMPNMCMYFIQPASFDARHQVNIAEWRSHGLMAECQFKPIRWGIRWNREYKVKTLSQSIWLGNAIDSSSRSKFYCLHLLNLHPRRSIVFNLFRYYRSACLSLPLSVFRFSVISIFPILISFVPTADHSKLEKMKKEKENRQPLLRIKIKRTSATNRICLSLTGTRRSCPLYFGWNWRLNAYLSESVCVCEYRALSHVFMWLRQFQRKTKINCEYP